ncbi:hypothetical protein [uncultured Vibrio sp.]|uniref:hypothetical protein n=1 Tax=uncultured Vibrio sp. TaxID=114054 RepID=UPI00260C211A|nr:hypothetical protein [uncultured Vibrio sp.]
MIDSTWDESKVRSAEEIRMRLSNLTVNEISAQNAQANIPFLKNSIFKNTVLRRLERFFKQRREKREERRESTLKIGMSIYSHDSK